MKWKKLGRIFNPVEHHLANNCFEFAQSPQALVFQNFVRIYFSTRERDVTGKFLSHVAFIDMDKEFKRNLGVSNETVIPLGKLGCFDEHGIFPINVLRRENEILAYTTGWNRKVSVSADAAIGLAVSYDNGLTFIKTGDGPILASSLNEPFLIGDAFVAIFEGRYHMWYIYGSRWITDPIEEAPQRIYKIAHATSADGISWNREGVPIISDILNENECQALPTVIKFDKRYHMFFCFREATGFRKIKERGYRIGYAWSDDLRHWTRADQEVGISTSEGEWDSDMLCYPHVFRVDEKIYLLYNGNEFGRFGFGLAVLEDKITLK